MTLRNWPNDLTSDVKPGTKVSVSYIPSKRVYLPLKYFISCFGGSLDMLLSLPIAATETENGLAKLARMICVEIGVESLLVMVRVVESMREVGMLVVLVPVEMVSMI